jgi:hypothetical protein
MRFDQIIQEEQLDEARMGQSDLDTFINSPEAQGIKAGFEAELCFVGKGGGGYDDNSYPEADYDTDERTGDIDDICLFFHDGDYNGRRDIQSLRESLQEAYWEWRDEQLGDAWHEVREEVVREYIEENDYTEDDEIEAYLRDHLDLEDEKVDAILASGPEDKELYAIYLEAVDYAKDQLDELVKQSLDDQDRSYELAREEWEEAHSDEYDEREWLRSAGLRYMSDVEREYDIQWPHYTHPEANEEGFNEENATQLADSLQNDLNVEVVVGGGYHSVKRTPTRWIIEADSSLEADSGDMPAEIISPPMPLGECLRKIQEFFMWADSEEAYSNESTGFHVGVSLPHVDGRVDFVKLALFLGDQYVLDQFGRSSNYYCKSAFDKIKNSAHTANVESAFELMRKGLIELATKTLKQTSGHGKYTSINMKNDYVEFRSMGAEYHTKVPEIIGMVKRYAYAMHIAARPDLFRDEYAKKLYKMLSRTADEDSVALFSRFSSGNLSKQELVAQLKGRNQERQALKQPANQNAWQIFNRSNNSVAAEFIASNENVARQKFHDYLQQRSLNPLNYMLRRAVEPQNTGQFTGEWKLVNAEGREVYRFGGVGNSQASANEVASRWLRSQGVIDSSEYDVLPVMA